MKKSVVELVVSVLFFSLGFLGMGLTSLLRVCSTTLYGGYPYSFLSYLNGNHLSWFFVLSVILFLLGLAFLAHCWVISAAHYRITEKKAEEQRTEDDPQRKEKTDALKNEIGKLLIGVLGLIITAMIVIFIFIMKEDFF